MNLCLRLFITFLFFFISEFKTYGQDNYLDYHQEVARCEKLIAEFKFNEAIKGFDTLFSEWDFIFLRDIKVATELSAFEKDYNSGFQFIRLGMVNGWTKRQISKNNNLSIFYESPQWKMLLSEYDSLHNLYLSRLYIPVKEEVYKMFKRDQQKALGALFRIGQKAKEKYAEKKFAPHSERQLMQLDQIMTQYGFPGEQLIGNNLWGSVILSHHNSISVNYNSMDTLFRHLKPKLMDALTKGEISPYEMAIIEDWRTAVLNDHEKTSFGFLGALADRTALYLVNKNRDEIGLRSVDQRNDLIDVEQSTGMNLHLTRGWQEGKIGIAK